METLVAGQGAWLGSFWSISEHEFLRAKSSELLADPPRLGA